ncbi:Smg-6, nonsense mediated mRNA decay factor [Kappamyces sp. JEL0680]|nr:Smg-6, nonsense mediated mRNA decay factor [Kappamyces sp. JEL0680]
MMKSKRKNDLDYKRPVAKEGKALFVPRPNECNPHAAKPTQTAADQPPKTGSRALGAGEGQGSQQALLKQTYREIQELEKILDSKPILTNFKARLVLFDKYSLLSTRDYRLSIKYDLDTRQWKYCLHSIFAQHRDLVSEMSDERLREWREYLEALTVRYVQFVAALKALDLKKPVWALPLCHLGDIARYQAQYLGITAQWDVARTFYLESCLLSPKNGLYWNQLGLIFRSLSLYLDSAHYLIKAQCVTKPFKGAQDTLVELMHFIGNVFELEESSSSIVIGNVENDRIRLCEVLFFKLMAQLYTKVDLDQFAQRLAAFLAALKQALPCLAALEAEQELYWWNCIAISTVGVFYLVSHHRGFDDAPKTTIQELALDLVFSMLEVLSPQAKTHEPSKLFVGLILSWIATFPSEYCFHRVSCFCSLQKFKPQWAKIAQMYQDLKPDGFDPPESLELAHIFERSPNLPEDAFTQAFEPVPSRSTQIMSFDWACSDPSTSLKRSARLILLVVYLSLQRSSVTLAPGSRFELPSQSSVTTPQVVQEISFDDFLEDSEDSDNEATGDCSQPAVDEWVVDDHEPSQDILDLKSKMAQLAASQSGKVRLIPGTTVIVFDTNTYLKDFSVIRRIIESQTFPIIVPLAVVTELEGLRLNETSVGDMAAATLEFFGQHVGKLFQIQTSRGNLLSTLAFHSEEWDSKYSNADDVILSICTFHKNVCLVTDDINLRLKARTIKIPVLDSAKKLTA